VKLKELFFTTLLILFSSNSYAAPENTARLNATLTQLLEKHNLAGISWAAISSDRVLLGASGFANIETNQAMTASTQVHVGSITKVMIAVATLRLVEQDKLRLEAPISDLLPVNLVNPWRESSPVQLKHLLEHTAGLDNIRMWQFLNTRPTPNTPLAQAFPQSDPSLLTLHSEPGTQYSYSNMGYALLAMIIEKISKERYESVLNRELLEPLSMKQSSFSFISQHNNKELAQGYLDELQKIDAQASYLRPAGQFTTTAQDMSKFLSFLLSDGKVGGQKFVDHALIKDLASPTTTDAARAGLNIGHGLALAIRDRHGLIAHCHPGTTFGFQANLCLFPEDRSAFFYSVNTDNETANYEEITKAIVDHLPLDKSISNTLPTIAISQARKDQLDGYYVLSPNNMYEFHWLDRLFNVQRLSWKNDKLIVQSMQKSARTLTPINNHLFQASNRSSASHVMIPNSTPQKFSDGLNTYKKVSLTQTLIDWLSVALGSMGLLYIVGASLTRSILALKNRSGNGLLARTKNSQISLPAVSIALLAIPLLAYQKQSFLKFGEFTLASGLMYTWSIILPISLIWSVLQTPKLIQSENVKILDLIAILFLLQFCLTLIFHGMFPVQFWRPL